jgi:ribosome-associated protein
MIAVTPEISLDDDEIAESFIRASGPGGQNVNKVSSAVQIRFDVRHSRNLPDAVAVRLMKLAGSRITHDGVLVLTAQRFREQERNRADARARLVALIAAAAVPPVKRRASRPTAGSKERRLESKSVRSGIKAARGKVYADD